MNQTPIIMFNEQNTTNYNEYVEALENMKSERVILRVAMSGLPQYRMNDLHLSMKYPIIDPMYNNNKSTIFFTTFSDVVQNLRFSDSEELIELPMGYLISEFSRVVDRDCVDKKAVESCYITRHLSNSQRLEKAHSEKLRKLEGKEHEKEREKLEKEHSENMRIEENNGVRKYHHAMTITHLHQFLITCGATPVDESSNWSGNDRVKGHYVYSNMLFRSYYQYREMPREEAIRYMRSLETGCPIIPKNMTLSEIYYSDIGVYHTKPLYVPIRPKSRYSTYPNSPQRLIYIYDCIAQWVARSVSTFYTVTPDLSSTGAPTGSYTYSINEIESAMRRIIEDSDRRIRTPNIMELSTFSEFKVDNTKTPKDKLRIMKDFFLLFGHEINIQKLDNIEEEDYIDRSTRVDPLTEYNDYWMRQKNRRSQHLESKQENDKKKLGLDKKTFWEEIMEKGVDSENVRKETKVKKYIDDIMSKPEVTSVDREPNFGYRENQYDKKTERSYSPRNDRRSTSYAAVIQHNRIAMPQPASRVVYGGNKKNNTARPPKQFSNPVESPSYTNKYKSKPARSSKQDPDVARSSSSKQDPDVARPYQYDPNRQGVLVISSKKKNRVQ